MTSTFRSTRELRPLQSIKKGLLMYSRLSPNSVPANGDEASLLPEKELEECSTQRAGEWRIEIGSRSLAIICMFIVLLGVSSFLTAKIISSPGSCQPPDEATNDMPATLGPAHTIIAKYDQVSSDSLQVPNVDISGMMARNRDNLQYILEDPCGHTSAEAKALGCHFDMIEMAWLPTECYDQQLEEQLLSLQDWRFWKYPNRSGEIAWQEAKLGEHENLYAEWDFHRIHCAFFGNKFFRSIASRGFSAVSQANANWFHVEHCRNKSVNSDASLHHRVSAVFPNGFPSCGIRSW